MALRLKDVDLDRKIDDEKDYKKQLHKLQAKLLEQQLALHREGRRAIFAMEGWDAAGKGGAIHRLTEVLDPRGFHVHPIGAPTAVEQGKHYLYRFWDKLPEPGTMAIFDRTWYGRVLVERIEKFCPKKAWKRAYREINEFERMLVDDGVILVKMFFHISQEEQLKRFEEREKDKLKRWKIGPDDWRNRKHAKKYWKAYDEMFEKTHTDRAPWTIVEGDWKWWARIKCLRTAVDALDVGA